MTGCWWLGFVAAGLLASALPAQSTWRVLGGEAPVRIVGPSGPVVHAGRMEPLDLPAGAYAVHFAADAAGKPRSLAFAVTAGDEVVVAVEPAAADRARAIALDAADWRDGSDDARRDGLEVRCFGADDARDYRAEATFASTAVAGTAGLVARWTSPRQYYRLVWHLARREVLLERCHDDVTLQLGRAEVAPEDGRDHTLALQVEGFRIAAYVDDALVAQAFDGAFTTGSWGTCSTPASVQWRRCSVGAPAPPRASAAVVGGRGAARYHAATTAIPGSLAVLEVLSPVAHPPPLRTAAGVEPWLLCDGAASVVVHAEWRGTLGSEAILDVTTLGTFAAQLRWLEAGIAGHGVLVRAVIVAADGDAVLGATPAVPVRL